MKVRYGFVSNSSSTSFTCDACGQTGSGWDASILDMDFIACDNGHIVCQCHIPNLNLNLEDEDNDMTHENDWEETTLCVEHCPCCQGTMLPMDEVAVLLAHAAGFIDRNETWKSLREHVLELYPEYEQRRAILVECQSYLAQKDSK